MKIKYLILLIGFVTLSCSSQVNSKETNIKEEHINEITYGEKIPFMLGIHNEHTNKDSLKIELIDNFSSTILIHKGEFQGWGMQWTNKKIKTGEYLLKLTWSEETGIKKTERKILIKPESKYFTINIELANDSFRGREHNAIYLDQYTKPLKDVSFVRNWNPTNQYQSDSLLIPDYEITNNNDSTLYGAYTRLSSSLSINWVQTHNVAFMGFKVKTDSGWVAMSCNAPRIEMNLENGEKGKTLKDMILGCPTELFEVDRTYKITINYMLNNRIFEQNKKQGEIEDNIYVEQNIYSFEDEFKIVK